MNNAYSKRLRKCSESILPIHPILYSIKGHGSAIDFNYHTFSILRNFPRIVTPIEGFVFFPLNELRTCWRSKGKINPSNENQHKVQVIFERPSMVIQFNSKRPEKWRIELASHNQIHILPIWKKWNKKLTEFRWVALRAPFRTIKNSSICQIIFFGCQRALKAPNNDSKWVNMGLRFMRNNEGRWQVDTWIMK